jgi:hypothetical protein
VPEIQPQLESLAHLSEFLPKRSVSLITRVAYRTKRNSHPATPGAQVHASQLEGPAHWMVLYPSLKNDLIFLSILSPHPHITKRFNIEADRKIIFECILRLSNTSL